VVGVTLRDSDDRKEVEKKFTELEADNIVVTTP
jgi:hypothetical protein